MYFFLNTDRQICLCDKIDYVLSSRHVMFMIGSKCGVKVVRYPVINPTSNVFYTVCDYVSETNFHFTISIDLWRFLSKPGCLVHIVILNIMSIHR